MRQRPLFLLHTIIECGLGPVVFFFPNLMAYTTGATLTEPEGLLLTRMLGVSIFTLGILTWKFRNIDHHTSKQAVLLGLTVFHGLNALLLLFGQIEQIRNSFGWTFFAGHLFFSLSFAYLMKEAKRQS